MAEQCSRKSGSTKAFWDKYAEQTIMPANAATEFVIHQLFRYLPKKNKIIIDLGCGSGSYSQILSEYGNLISIDISSIHLQKIVLSNGLAIQADAHRLPLKSDLADGLFCNQVLEHVKDPINLISEIYRVLNPGGIAVITTPNRFAPSRFLDGGWKSYLDKTHIKELNYLSALSLQLRIFLKLRCKIFLHGYTTWGKPQRLWRMIWGKIPTGIIKLLVKSFFYIPLLSRGFVLTIQKKDKKIP